MPIKTSKDLNVYRESYQLAFDTSRVTRNFPSAEQFGLARQLRRAARALGPAFDDVRGDRSA